MAEFFEVVLAQRACRSFLPREVPDDLVLQVLTAATHAPSAENRQPWEFVVVRDAGLRTEIGALTRRAWREGGKDFSRDRLPPRLFAEVDEGAEGGVSLAPVVVVVCGDSRRGHPAAMGASVFPATQNLLLAANALGLGSALTTLPAAGRLGTELSELLGLPPHVTPHAVVPIGWPARRLGPPRREPAADHLHRDRYGNAW
ncbi:MAG: nitroreductase family protein [Acidimicrobiales bacterium]